MALIVYSTVHGPRHRATVCMTFNAGRACKTVSSKTEADAIRSAKQNACADIASGVTDTMRCEQSEPLSVSILQ